MSRDNVTPLHPSAGSSFDDIYDRMQEELSSMRCAIAALEASDWEKDECASAAIALLRRTFRALDSVHDDFASWNMAVRERQEVTP